MEASGTIVALPIDEAVLNDPRYKERDFKIGTKVTLVCYAQSQFEKRNRCF